MRVGFEEVEVGYAVKKVYYQESPYASIETTTDGRFVVVNNVVGLPYAILNNWDAAKTMRFEISQHYQNINNN
jgi:hypothetical protein